MTMNDEIYSALHDLELARQSLEKALCALAHCNGWGKDQMVNIAVDYLMEANARFLYQVEKRLMLLEHEARRKREGSNER